jgi:hypothetical protein
LLEDLLECGIIFSEEFHPNGSVVQLLRYFVSWEQDVRYLKMMDYGRLGNFIFLVGQYRSNVNPQPHLHDCDTKKDMISPHYSSVMTRENNILLNFEFGPHMTEI